MKTMKLTIAAALMTSVSVADVTYSYENDGKTYVATATTSGMSISQDAINVLDSNSVTNFIKRGRYTLIIDKGSSFTGDVLLETSVRLAAENALGVGPGEITVLTNTATVNGCTIAKKLNFDCGTSWRNDVGISAWEGNSFFKEKVTFTDRNFQIYPYARSRLVFEGGFEGDGYLYLREANGGTLVFTNNPVKLSHTVYLINGTKPSSGGYCAHLVFSVAGNSLVGIGNTDPRNHYRFAFAKLSTTVDWAFDNASQSMNFGAGSFWDLCGTSQRVGFLDAENLDKDNQVGPVSIITNSSSSSAVLYLNQTEDAAPWVVFGGDLSVCFSGSKTTTIDHTMTASGEISVNGGTLAFTADGSWTDASKVTVADGAAVSMVSGDTFGGLTEISLNGSGALSIAAGEGGTVVTQTVGFLTIDGVAKSCGFYEAGDGVLEVRYSGHRDVTDGTLEIGEGEAFTVDDTVLCGEFDKIVLGPGAKLDIQTSAFFLDDASFTLTLGSGSELTLAEGIDIHVASATVDGVTVAPGRYSASDLDWLKGEGEIFIPYGTIAGTDVTWTAGGTDTLMTTPENWSSTVNLGNGAVRAVFSSGSEAKVVGEMFLNGIAFNASGAFDVAAADGNALLRLSSGGIASAGSGENFLSAPTCIDGDQTWRIDSNLTISGEVTSDPLARYAVRKTGAADLVWKADSDFAGDFHLDEKEMRFSGGITFGSGTGRLITGPRTSLILNGVTINKDVVVDNNDCSDWNHHNISLWAGESVINGRLTFGNRNLDIYSWKDSRLVLRGGVEDMSANNGGYLRFRTGNGGVVLVTDRPIKVAHQMTFVPQGLGSDGFVGCIEFAVAGNAIPAFGGDNGKEDLRPNQYKIKTSVDWAFDNPNMLVRAGYDSMWDLCGTEQRVGHLNTKEVENRSPMEVTNSSETPAVLYVNSNADSTPWLDFTGNLSVDFTGNHTTVINRAMTAEGDITVNSGTLAFADGGSWRNARNIEVNGAAKVTVGSGGTFHRAATMSLASMDSLDIASGASFRVVKLSVGGAEMPYGDYSFGSGTLSVGPVAMRVIVR